MSFYAKHVLDFQETLDTIGAPSSLLFAIMEIDSVILHEAFRETDTYAVSITVANDLFDRLLSEYQGRGFRVEVLAMRNMSTEIKIAWGPEC